MVNWYYVVGSERVGPVSEEMLKRLLLDNEINHDTYVWKKGFANWERLKEVSELNLATTEPEAEVAAVDAPEKIEEETQEALELEESSPEVEFNFDWKKLRDHEELFFVRIGKDRKNFEGTDIYGPYSHTELKEALKDKRINLQTLIFTPGMTAWTKIADTPINENYKAGSFSGVSLNEVPLIMVFDHSPLPLFTVVKKAGTKEGVLLGAGPFAEFQHKTVKASLYVGNEIKAKNVKIMVQSYDVKEQAIECHFVDLDQDAKRIMLNHAV